jgi:hypothetical protein
MDDTYDDGLVHSHNWAEPLASGGSKPQGAETPASISSRTEEERVFDDGLVHGHDWARS